ncbi:MAG: HAD family hydrolase [Elainellaceae cyanobacterium]
MQRFHCQAVLFDLDGTLVNSTPNVEDHWRRWATEHSFDPEEILAISHGRPTADTIRIIAPTLDAEAEAAKIDRSQAKNMFGIMQAPGAKDLLVALPANSWAIVTSGNWAIATNRLRHLDLPIPDVLITTDAVTHYKPHPEGYLKAAARLGVAPEHCLVIEDAPVGIQAGRAAGMNVIAVATTYPPNELTTADACVSGLTKLTIALHDSRDGKQQIEVAIED